MGNLPTLFIADKIKAGQTNPRISVAFKEIERWVSSVDIAGGGGYASLTGPGETSPSGALTQTGPFIVYGGLTNAGAPNPGFGVDIEAGIQYSGGTGTTGGPGGILIEDWGVAHGNGVRINSSQNNVYLNGSGTGGGFSLTLGGTSSPAPGGASAFTVSGNGGIWIADESTGGITLSEAGSSGDIEISNSGSGSILFSCSGEFAVQSANQGIVLDTTSTNGITLSNSVGSGSGITITAATSVSVLGTYVATLQAGLPYTPNTVPATEIAVVAGSDMRFFYDPSLHHGIRLLDRMYGSPTGSGGLSSWGVGLFVLNGNPNTIGYAGWAQGDILFDYGTPGIWQWNGTTWVAH